MKRLWLLTRQFLYLIMTSISALFRLTVLRVIDKGRAEHYLLDRAGSWARGAVARGGARVEVVGLDKIPQDGAVLYVANHQGALDIPVLMGCLPGSPAFVAKKELFGIPLLGFWMRRIGCVSMDRESPREALRAIKDAALQVRAGRRLVLFPEGTRSRDPGGKMGSFKRGSLKLAVVADAVVVPVTVEGSRFLLNSGVHEGFNGVVKVFVGDPVAVGELDAGAQKQLPDTLHDVIESTLLEHHMGAIDAERVQV